jgi:hypothetical protein
MGQNTTTPDPSAASGRAWDSLTFSERRTVQFLLDHDVELGRDVRRAAGDDHDFALWLMAAANAFADIVGAFPHDLADPAWRKWHSAWRLSPQLAAKVALNLWLRLTPTARVIDEQLACPVCDRVGEIVEQDKAVRFNSLDLCDGAIFAGTGDADFEHDRNLCQLCGSTVRLPSRIEDWS